MFIKELVFRCFQFMEEGILKLRYGGAHYRREICALMCEAGEDTLLESLKLKGADIPPQSEQQQQDEGESDDVVEVDLETKVKDLSAEQAVQAAQINSLSEDMDHLKDSVFKGGEGIVKLTLSMSSLLTAFQQQAAHAGFKLPMAALEGLNRPEVGDSTAAVVAPGTTRGALHTSAVASSLARRPLFGQIPGFVQAQGATSGAQRSRASDTGPAAGASSSAADQVGAVACVTTAAAGQPGASVRAPPAGAGQPGAYAGAPPAGAVQPSSSAGALLAGVRLPGATAGVSPAAAGQPGAAAVIPTAAAGHPSVEAGVSTAAAGQPVAAAAIPIAAAGQPKAVAGVLTAVAGQPGSAGVALTAAAAQPCATAGTPKAAAGQHGPATGVAINAGVVRPGDDCWDILGPGSDLTNFPPCVQVQDATGSQAADDAPRTAEPPTFLFAAEALDTGSILPGHTSSAPRGTLLNMPSQQVLPSPAASSSFMPSTQVGEEEEAASKGFTGVTKKKGKNEWVARIVLDRTSNSLIVINNHFQSEVAAARSIAAESHVMFVDNPTRGDLIPLTDGDRAKLQGCTAQQCELMVRQKFWHKWEQWAEFWPAAKAKYDEK
ncbi:unnamed protein product [Closterium sp. NIES-53]